MMMTKAEEMRDAGTMSWHVVIPEMCALLVWVVWPLKQVDLVCC